MHLNKTKPAHRGCGGGLRNADLAGVLIGSEDMKSACPKQHFSRVYVVESGLAALFPDLATARAFQREAAR